MASYNLVTSVAEHELKLTTVGLAGEAVKSPCHPSNISSAQINEHGPSSVLNGIWQVLLA